jgi:DNA-directed RNA polymerase subunit M
VKFCPKCGTRLKLKQVKAEKGGATITLLCENCGYSDKAGRTVTQTTEEELSEVPTIKVVGEKESRLSTLPTTKIECPKCGHDEQFYRCLKCNHTWRSYS